MPTPAALALAEALMQAVGQTVRLADEALMDAVTAVSGSGPAYVFLMIEALAAAGEAEGLERGLALELARATVAGAGALAESSTKPPAAAARRRDEPRRHHRRRARGPDGGNRRPRPARCAGPSPPPLPREAGDLGRLTAALARSRSRCNPRRTPMFDPKTFSFDVEKMTEFFKQNDFTKHSRRHEDARRRRRGAGGGAAEEHGRAGRGQQGGGRRLPGPLQEADGDLRGDDGRGADST